VEADIQRTAAAIPNPVIVSQPAALADLATGSPKSSPAAGRAARGCSRSAALPRIPVRRDHRVGDEETALRIPTEG